MRIAIFAPDPAARDGIAAHTQQLVTAWEQAGHVVMWCYPSNGTHVVASRALSGIAGEKWRRSRSLKAALRAFQPNVVVVLFAVSAVRMSLASLVFSARALKRTGVPVLICCHEASRELALLGPICRLIYRSLRWCSTDLLAFSEIESRTMLDRGLASAVTTVPHGVDSPEVEAGDVDRVRRAYDIRSAVILAVGWITHSKGTDLLTNAMPEVVRRLGDVQGVIAGEVRPRRGVFRIFGRADQRYAAALKSAVAGAAGQVKMVGYVASHDMAPLMRAATIIVLPYRSVTQSGIAGRALASGTPIVASDQPGFVAQLGDAARYFRSGDPNDLARVLIEVISSPELRDRMREAALCRRDSESYERVAQQILDAADGVGHVMGVRGEHA